jgi:hypothetical protein
MDVTFEDRLLSLQRDDRRSTFGKIASVPVRSSFVHVVAVSRILAAAKKIRDVPRLATCISDRAPARHGVRSEIECADP